MKVLVTGVCGQLGYDVMNELAKRGISCIGSDILAESSFPNYVQMDITKQEEVERVFQDVSPDAVIHCAAWTQVDAAEDEDKRELVEKINAVGTRYIAECCQKANCKMMYISTDYVFNGEGTTPWKPDCKDYAPLSVYGSTKLLGEQAVTERVSKFFIVRIAWVFGKNGNNFIKTMLKLADKGLTQLRVVDDQIGTPTYTLDLAPLLVEMILSEKYGFYHATNEGGYISWADFAEEIFKQAGIKMEVLRVTTAEYGLSKAKRPFNSRMDKSKLRECGFEPLPDWQDALSRYLRVIR